MQINEVIQKVDLSKRAVKYYEVRLDVNNQCFMYRF